MEQANKTISEKVIFIDIDGVLTNVEDGSSYLCGNPSTYRISEKNLENLLLVLKAEPQTRVVISSNWRRFEGDHPAFEYNRKIYYGCLPKLRWMLSKWIVGDLTHERHLTKSEALELWFEDNSWLSKKFGKYAILEDEPFAEGFSSHPIFYKHTVKTNKQIGFSREDVEKTLSLIK